MAKFPANESKDKRTYLLTLTVRGGKSSARHELKVVEVGKPATKKSPTRPAPATTSTTTTSTTTTTTTSLPSLSLGASLDPSYSQSSANPLKVTWSFSASASENGQGDSSLPDGVLEFFSDGSLANSLNVGGSTTSGQATVTYGSYGNHTADVVYDSGTNSATTGIETFDIQPLTTTTSLSVTGNTSGGGSAQLSATVTDANGNAVSPAGGALTFQIGSVSLATSSAGQTSCTLSVVGTSTIQQEFVSTGDLWASPNCSGTSEFELNNDPNATASFAGTSGDDSSTTSVGTSLVFPSAAPSPAVTSTTTSVARVPTATGAGLTGYVAATVTDSNGNEVELYYSNTTLAFVLSQTVNSATATETLTYSQTNVNQFEPTCDLSSLTSATNCTLTASSGTFDLDDASLDPISVVAEFTYQPNGAFDSTSSAEDAEVSTPSVVWNGGTVRQGGTTEQSWSSDPPSTIDMTTGEKLTLGVYASGSSEDPYPSGGMDYTLSGSSSDWTMTDGQPASSSVNCSDSYNYSNQAVGYCQIVFSGTGTYTLSTTYLSTDSNYVSVSGPTVTVDVTS